MDRRCVALCAAACAVLALPAAAPAQVTTDLNNWNLTETPNWWGGGTQFHISSSGDGTASYRWLDSPNKTTVIAAHRCTDVSLINSVAISVNNTSYHHLFSAWAGVCFMLRGRTAIGSGSMVNHDGRVRR